MDSDKEQNSNRELSDTALKRWELIAPLTDPKLDPAKKVELRKKLASENDISDRTIRRYEAAYIKDGIFGLSPKSKKGYMSERLPDNYSDIIREAIQLKKEVPTRSVTQIIYILEGEGWAQDGTLKRSTLQRYLCKAGFGERQMKKYKQDTESKITASRRFCRPHRMELVQADIKYGVGILYKKSGIKQTAYLSSIIDDHSRHILWSEWYTEQTAYCVDDVFRKAILRYGHFDCAYTDNGSQYITKHIRKSCGKLGITLRRARPRSGKSKGKIEKFHQVVDQFIAEAKLVDMKEIDELNSWWFDFLNEYYEKKPHDGIREYYKSHGITLPPEGISPLQEWERDTRKLCFYDANKVGEAFLYSQTTTVDQGSQIRFNGVKYDVDSSLIGAKVEFTYDPMNPAEITVHYKGMEPFKVKPLPIESFCAVDKKAPVSVEKSNKTDGSRLLNVARHKAQQNAEIMANAISFGMFNENEEKE